MQCLLSWHTISVFKKKKEKKKSNPKRTLGVKTLRRNTGLALKPDVLQPKHSQTANQQ